MKVVIPTDDKKNIAKFTGRAKYFHIYEIDDNQITLKQEIDNHHDHQHDHDHDHDHDHHHEDGHSHDREVSMMAVANTMICGHMGKHFKESLEKHSISTYVTKTQDIREAIQEFLKNQ
jgi:predicted Fe-Mo cluster-binding NifX family protein